TITQEQTAKMRLAQCAILFLCLTLVVGSKLAALSKFKWKSKIAKLLLMSSLHKKIIFIVPIPFPLPSNHGGKSFYMESPHPMMFPMPMMMD
ncbi:hypothetical protein AVEN_239756-2-1, partial [Araneus ventricosus]